MSKNKGKNWVDFRNKKKGKYVLFFDSYPYGVVKAEVYSSISLALDNMVNNLEFQQSLHDASGKLLAWVERYELVMSNELKAKAS
jgi:hypothetical protein